MLTHWDRVTHIIYKLSTIASDNGLSPDQHQAIILTNNGMLLILALGTNFSEIVSEIHMHSHDKKTYYPWISAGMAGKHTQGATRVTVCEMAVIWSRPQSVNWENVVIDTDVRSCTFHTPEKCDERWLIQQHPRFPRFNSATTTVL